MSLNILNGHFKLRIKSYCEESHILSNHRVDWLQSVIRTDDQCSEHWFYMSELQQYISSHSWKRIYQLHNWDAIMVYLCNWEAITNFYCINGVQISYR